jgi:hypothetical protein
LDQGPTLFGEASVEDFRRLNVFYESNLPSSEKDRTVAVPSQRKVKFEYRFGAEEEAQVSSLPDVLTFMEILDIRGLSYPFCAFL